MATDSLSRLSQTWGHDYAITVRGRLWCAAFRHPVPAAFVRCFRDHHPDQTVIADSPEGLDRKLRDQRSLVSIYRARMGEYQEFVSKARERVTRRAGPLSARDGVVPPWERNGRFPEMVTLTLLGMSCYAPTKQQVSQAKAWVRRILAEERVHDDTVQDISLCVDELAENARKHGPSDGEISVAVHIGDDTIRIDVTDGGSASIPHIKEEDLLALDGRGLRIVESISRRWGQYSNHDLKQVVWCEFEKRLARLTLAALRTSSEMGGEKGTHERLTADAVRSVSF